MSEIRIARATDEEVRAFAVKRLPDELGRRLYMEFAESSPGGARVARDEAVAIGIAFAHALEDEAFFSELFVEPSFRGSGVGWKLLQEVMKDDADSLRSGLVDASDAASLAFFLRRGISLHVPVLRVAGAIPREDDLGRMAAGDYRFQIESIDPVAHRFALDALDREVRGTSRAADHAMFSRLATGTLFTLDGEGVGYAYVWPDGRIGPLAAASGAYLVQLFAFALVTLRRRYSASWCTALVPGSNVRIMRAAMRIGLTLEAVNIFATDQSLLDLNRYIGFHALDF